MVSVSDFKKEVNELGKEISVKPKEVHIRTMSRKWASCSSNGRLTFSTTILNEPIEVRTKVIVHELLHLKYPNHGKMFKSLYLAHMNKKGIACSINDAFSIKS
jgi:predicted metal-dependent hydrolase